MSARRGGFRALILTLLMLALAAFGIGAGLSAAGAQDVPDAEETTPVQPGDPPDGEEPGEPAEDEEAENEDEADPCAGNPFNLCVMLAGDKEAYVGDEQVDEVDVGQTFDWVLELTNNGPTNAEFGIKIWDYLPDDYELVSWAWSSGDAECHDGQDWKGVPALVCTRTSLDVTATVTVTLTGYFDIEDVGEEGVTRENCFAAEATNDPAWRITDICDTVTIVDGEDALVGVSKDGPETAAPGEEFEYTITVPNESEVPALNVEVVDTLPPEVEFVDVSWEPEAGFDCDYVEADHQVVCTGAQLDPGAELVITISAKVADDAEDGAVLTNTVTVDWTNRDTNQPEGQADTTVESTPPTSDAPVTTGGGSETGVSGEGGTTTEGADGDLPFTGAALGPLLFAGIVLLLVGGGWALAARKASVND